MSQTINSDEFYHTYHGHRTDHLLTLLTSLRLPRRYTIYLAGDSSLDNKFWFEGSVKAVNGYESILNPPKSKQDIAYWLNYELVRRKLSYFALNCAVEESSVGSRSFCRLLEQDKVVRDTITADDILVVSLGGNDIALKPNVCTILATLALICCTTTECLRSCAGGCALPCDDYACGCGCGCLSNLFAFPPGYGYFLHLFGTKIQSFLDRLTDKMRPKIIVICMIYYPDERPGQSWADGILAALGYNSNPKKLQLLIDRVFQDATEQISLPGTRIIALPLSKALDGKNTEDYSARVEPSIPGGHKIANLILDALFWDAADTR